MDLKRKLIIVGAPLALLAGVGSVVAAAPPAHNTSATTQGPDTKPEAAATVDADGAAGPNLQQGVNVQQGPDTQQGGADAAQQ